MLICKNADNAIRWTAGERLDHLFEERCDELNATSAETCWAVITEDAAYTFRELDNRANQLARFLLHEGVGAGDRVGLLFDKSFETYVALLAVLKVNAAYVPLDIGFPEDRIQFILDDANVKVIVSMSEFASLLDGVNQKKIFCEACADEIDKQPTARLSLSEKPAAKDELCYIIYTSGTTGNPKGVAIQHGSICNFVRVAAEVYGVRLGDRVYQGMTIAFDFSVEEIWVPLMAGATLVPSRSGTSLVGAELADFLDQREITVLCCVPTLLATIERDLPDLRILLVSGEACPQNLVTRWSRPGRRILNAYGPTETSVTATLTELHPDKPVTIGGPLPTYTIVILDEHEDREALRGELGEIGIAGVGLAVGYLNRPELTQAKFVPDFLNIPGNPSRRIYRTGDLGRINEADEIEFHGRIDTQVKIRGYRIELSEIESVLMEMPGVAQAVVATHEQQPGVVELVAYYTLGEGGKKQEAAAMAQALRKRLPGYMVPAYFEELTLIPMSVSNKAERKKLPAPQGPRASGAAASFVAPRNSLEETLASALIEVLRVDRVSVTDNFFYDLGAHSLLMARFCTAIRKRYLAAAVSMKDVYLNQTVEKLAIHLRATEHSISAAPQRQALPFRIPSNLDYYMCGFLQICYYVVYGYLLVWMIYAGGGWALSHNDHPLEFYWRFVAFATGSFAILTAVPIALKWTLIGKWKQEVIPVWSLRYFRFWVVKNLIQSSPIVLLSGSPIYNSYLRMLGAKIGSGSVVITKLLPVCTDLISIGENTILRRETVMLGYKAQANYIYIGQISIGDNAIVGEASVIDIDTVIENGAQLGLSSSLQSGQRLAAGRRYHGSPAQETHTDYRTVEGAPCTLLRRGVFTAVQLFLLLAVYAPVTGGVSEYYLSFNQAAGGASAPNLRFLAETMIVSFLCFLCIFCAFLLLIFVVPKVLQLFIREDKVYPLYGFHYYVHGAIVLVSNSWFYNVVFGDSAFIVHYLRGIGYRLNRIVQTGSNFGLNQRHDNPMLCEVGTGTMVSDGLFMLNAAMSSSSFRLSKVRIGENNYLGNYVNYPAGAHVGDNCLLATKVLTPIDGPVRENVGLLGSPCFEIPRVVDRDMRVKLAVDESAWRARVRAKTRVNLVTITLYLLTLWFQFYAGTIIYAVSSMLYPNQGSIVLFASSVLNGLLMILMFAFVERASLGFGRLNPLYVSMYDPAFWRHERHWKFCASPLIVLFKGTPFKNMVTRLLGVKIGRRVFDDGCLFFDKSLLEIGDYANLNEGCMFMAHSLEEGVFKADYIRIGEGCSIGVSALVHYGVSMGNNVVLDPDSFLMKGEAPEPGSVWRGNPARAMRAGELSQAGDAELPRSVAAQ